MFDEFKSETIIVIIAVVGALCFCFGLAVMSGGQAQSVAWACGPCDHVAECGLYECKAGVEGWHLKPSEVR